MTLWSAVRGLTLFIDKNYELCGPLIKPVPLIPRSSVPAVLSLQFFDTVGWASEGASGL